MQTYLSIDDSEMRMNNFAVIQIHCCWQFLVVISNERKRRTRQNLENLQSLEIVQRRN